MPVYNPSPQSEPKVGVSVSHVDQTTGTIIDAALRIHRDLGPGLLESVYEVVLAHALAAHGFRVERQKSIPFSYNGMAFDEGLRVDLLVEGLIIVELKSVQSTAPVHRKQLLTYLRLSGMPVGLLINFGAPTLKEGLHRLVNAFAPEPHSTLRVNQRHSLPTSHTRSGN